MKYNLFVFVIIVLTGCFSNKDKSDPPNLALVKDHSISVDDVYYQFYEKYGFTDACVHYRTLYKCNKFRPSSSGWKRLPITSTDLKKINSITNKMDAVPAFDYDIQYRNKEAFKDISLEMKEYIKQKESSCVLNLKNGYYYYSKGVFKVFDLDKKAFYIEVHKCDG